MTNLNMNDLEHWLNQDYRSFRLEDNDYGYMAADILSFNQLPTWIRNLPNMQQIWQIPLNTSDSHFTNSDTLITVSDNLITDDFLITGDGDDHIRAGGGDDLVVSSRGNDYVNGGAGDDVILSGGGADEVRGGAGNDKIFGDADISYSYAPGASYSTEVQLTTNPGMNSPFMVTESDWSNHDELYGGNGDDEVYGGAGDDSVYGDNGNDTVDGGSGKDKVYGGNGDDVLNGGADADIVYGGNGDDTIKAGDSYNQGKADLLFGGAGDDVMTGNRHDGNIMYGEWDDDRMTGGYLGDLLDGGAGDDIIDGDGGNDVLYGRAGNDRLDGGWGNDVVMGGGGDDVIDGGQGIDILFGGAGADTFEFTANPGDLDQIKDFEYGVDQIRMTGFNEQNVEYINFGYDLLMISDGTGTIYVEGENVYQAMFNDDFIDFA